jgi:hypothetical protein
LAEKPILKALTDVAIALTALGGATFFVIWLAGVLRAPMISGDREFATLLVLSGLIGVAALLCMQFFYRLCRGKIAPWLAAVAALWFSAEWSLKLGPPASSIGDDPRIIVGAMGLLGAIVLVGLAIFNGVVAYEDWERRAERDAVDGARHG